MFSFKYCEYFGGVRLSPPTAAIFNRPLHKLWSLQDFLDTGSTQIARAPDDDFVRMCHSRYLLPGLRHDLFPFFEASTVSQSFCISSATILAVSAQASPPRKGEGEQPSPTM
jgi:hypothetical protein